MFDPINGPANHYQGPATGLGSEAGDTWHDAVSKINDNFKNIVKWIEGGSNEAADTEARKRITDLEEAVTALQKRNDEIEGNMKALLGSFDKFLAAQQAPPKPADSMPADHIA